MLNGENYYMVTSKMPEQGWVFAVVVRECNRLNIIEKDRRELGQTIAEMAAKSIIFTGYDTEKLSQQTKDINLIAIVSKLGDIGESLRATEKAIAG